MRGNKVSWLLVLVVALASVGVAAAEDSPIGKKIAGFTARDLHGKSVSLADFSDRKAVVVAFLGTECPLAKLYAPRLEELAREFADRGVVVVGVNSNQQDSITELAHYASEYKLDFPLLKDLGNAIADQFGAIRTPEVFLLDGDRVVRYWGRIDDQFGFQGKGIAYQRNEPKRRDLAIAIEELLAGKPVSQPIAANQGCHIGRVKKPDANSDVTYAGQIAAILNKNCVFCHRAGQIAPFPLTSYDESVGLGRDDSGSDQRTADAAVARRSEVRPLPQRRPAERPGQRVDQPLGRRGAPGRRS